MIMRQQKGFTLIEILIVIAIIAILAGLIFAVLSEVRERGRIAHCVNSMKQVGAALLMYAQDYDGFAPPYSNSVGIDIQQRYFPNYNDPALFEAAYQPYTKNKQIWYCPSDPYAGQSTLDLPQGSEPPTWRAHKWNNLNHKATSYYIESVCATRVLAPVRIDNPPNYLQKHIAAQIPMPPHPIPKSWLKPLPYADDFTNGTAHSPLGIVLSFSGSVRVKRRAYLDENE
jgi:prepilin-type N-terminal cleavage/methylation domain-containing protein